MDTRGLGRSEVVHLVPAEGHVQGEEAVLLPGLQLLLVDVVLGPVPAPEEEEGGADRFSLLLLPGSLLGARCVA